MGAFQTGIELVAGNIIEIDAENTEERGELYAIDDG